jgi:hypothetical protein
MILQWFLVAVWLGLAIAMILVGFGIGWVCARARYRHDAVEQLRDDMDQFGGQR